MSSAGVEPPRTSPYDSCLRTLRKLGPLALAASFALAAAVAATSAGTPGIAITMPTEGQVLQGPTASVTIAFTASCDTNGTKLVVAGVYGDDGKQVASSGTVFDLTHPITLVVTLPDNRDREDFTVKLQLTCGAATVDAGERHFTVVRPTCDPNLLATALREYETARQFALQGVKELNEAAGNIREFRNDYIKESVEIGVEKLSLLGDLEVLSHTAVEAAEVTAFYVGIGVTIEELAFKFYPVFKDARGLEKEAADDFALAEQWADRAKGDLDRALAQGPCLGPTEQQLNKALDQQRIEEQAQALIDSWDHGQAVYRDPANGDILDERAALQRARARVAHGTRSVQAAQQSAKKVYASAKQIRAALVQMNRAQTLHASAKQRLDRYETLVDGVRGKLTTLLGS